ncbi:MAG: hypothetical protein WB421_19430 [Terriglobales bacterium]
MPQDWKPGVKNLGAILLFLLGGASAYLYFLGIPPKESKLIDNFHAHRAAYERLRDMLTSDTQVRAVYVRFGVETINSGLPHPPSEVNFPVSRYDEYHALLDQISSAKIFRGGENNSDICIAVWAYGFGGDTRHIANCWLDHPPVNQIASLQNFYRTAKPRHPIFRHIDGNWYLWADW